MFPKAFDRSTEYELIKFVAMDISYGCIHSFMRQITSQKSSKARKILFIQFLIELRSLVVEDQPIATDYETR